MKAPIEITTVACIGAGLIGQGWATLFSANGLDVFLYDLSEEILNKSMQQIASNLGFLETHGLLPQSDAKAALERITPTTHISEAVGCADYVQESVPDDYEIKKQVFRKMDGAAPDHAVLASSASGLLMSQIQIVTQKPERCVLAHPILPVQLIPVVEIAGGDKTALETVDLTRRFLEGLGKLPIVLNHEVPGYILNRLQAAMLREAIDLVHKGVASPEQVDKAFCFGTGIRDPFVGPFLKMHLTANGIEDFLDNYSQSYSYRWQTMEAWTTIPPAARQPVINGTREMEMVRKMPIAEIRGWRNRMLAKLLKLINEN